MSSGKKYLAATAVVAATMACAPATALGVVSATVAGNDGAPVALSPAGGVTIANLHPTAAVHLDATDAKGYIWTVTDQTGAQVAETDFFCWHPEFTPNQDYPVTYRGNETYTLHIQMFSDDNCKVATSTANYPFAIAAGVTLGPSGANLLLGQTAQFDSAIPPNGSADYVYALNGVVQADGALAGATQPAFRDPTTGKVSVTPTAPGTYTIVGRASYDSVNFTPWSGPVTFRVFAPFALKQLTFPDARGPRYELRGTVAYGSGGRVTVAAAKGKKGRHFRRLGKAKMSSSGAFKVRFTMRKLGYYRLRFSYPGSGAVARGTTYEVVRIRRIIL